MAVVRVQVRWSGVGITGGGLSTFYFEDEIGTAAQQVAAVGTFLTATDSQRNTGLVWETDQDVATLNQETGDLISITSVTSATGTGSGSGDRLPPASQGLLRLFTSSVVGGRLLRGRLFLPGAVESSSNGVPGSTYMSTYNSAAATLISSANANWQVWSRTHGFAGAVSTADTWSQWAVLRSRRD